ncbi:MAG: hypothetical protein ACI8W8_002876 [Rhodothermales bacterium]|jgi:hypothetical protein
MRGGMARTGAGCALGLATTEAVEAWTLTMTGTFVCLFTGRFLDRYDNDIRVSLEARAVENH